MSFSPKNVWFVEVAQFAKEAARVNIAVTFSKPKLCAEVAEILFSEWDASSGCSCSGEMLAGM
ncbi:hypothetical protein SH668x_000792 [Planctomicrobium sp. SH668]|uniref:hypothetical protein n=1 Tax=Planctomicrobium sp. SH668 TaxID=3448126 RepID=UPI003F5AF520